MQIIPAILATSLSQYMEDLKEIESCDSLLEWGWVQIDFMDNIFVQNKSIDPSIVLENPPELKIEAHMMVQNPLFWMDKLIKLKIQKVIIPCEIGENATRFISEAKGRPFQTGLSLNPETSVQVLQPFVSSVDSILVMSVNPGFQTQEFLVEVLDKVSQIKAINSNLLVGVDGGISAANVKLIASVGADYAVVGSHLLKGEINKNLQKIMEALNG